MFGDARRAVVVGGIVAFLAGGLVGFAVGRSGRPEEAPVAPERSPSPEPAAEPPAAGSPIPGGESSITSEGRVLLDGDPSPVVAAADAPCQTLVTPGALPECGEVVMAGNRVVWMIERTTAAGATAHRVRILTFSFDAGGWVEWLSADDPTGERWVEVKVLSADLTADGTAELLVGFRGADERETLEYDVVGSGLDGVPTVLAHPDPPQRGAVVLVAGSIHEYAAVYPGGEPACCPPSFVRRVIDFEDGLFRVTSADSVPPNAVPLSQL